MDIAVQPAKAKKTVTVGRVVLYGFLVVLLVSVFLVRQGKSLVGAVAGPTILTDEQVQLKEGQWKAYEFQLPAARKVEVHVGAGPKSVDVRTIEEKDYAAFEKAEKSIRGGQFMYVPTLSSEKVTKYDGSSILHPGRWYVVVMRPKEHLLFGDATNATVKILAY